MFLTDISYDRVTEIRDALYGDSSRVEKVRPVRYINGNYYVTHHESIVLSKTAFRVNEELIAMFPDSIDLKITNRCSWGCPFCHESSGVSGKHFDPDRTKRLLQQLPEAPIELAIGGGNVLECPDIVDFLKWIVLDTVFLPRITISSNDLKKYQTTTDKNYKNLFEEVAYLINSVGVSMYDSNLSLLNNLRGVVCHVILGVYKPEDLKKLLSYDACPKTIWGMPDYSYSVLVLGYKQFGRAAGSKYPKEIIEESKEIIVNAIKDYRYRKPTISFDNLAIEQLGLSEDLITDWNSLYLGEEGKYSMYVDAVEETYAKTSRSEKRVSWDEMGIVEFFNKQKDDTINF